MHPVRRSKRQTDQQASRRRRPRRAATRAPRRSAGRRECRRSAAAAGLRHRSARSSACRACHTRDMVRQRIASCPAGRCRPGSRCGTRGRRRAAPSRPSRHGVRTRCAGRRPPAAPRQSARRRAAPAAGRAPRSRGTASGRHAGRRPCRATGEVERRRRVQPGRRVPRRGGRVSGFVAGVSSRRPQPSRCRWPAICARTCAGAVPPSVLRALSEPRSVSASYTSSSIDGVEALQRRQRQLAQVDTCADRAFTACATASCASRNGRPFFTR